MTPKPLNQHDVEIQANRKAWERKPLLQEIYRCFYLRISAALETVDGAGVLEIGSGMGTIKEVLPRCVTSDIFPNPWLDRTESAYSISMEAGSLNGIILFDVWHHLEFPANALKEFARVLKPGGRVVLFEPAMGLLGRVVYGAFHHEPLGFGSALPALEPHENSQPELRYYAAQGNGWRMFKPQDIGKLYGSFELKAVQTYSALTYVASGGFSSPQLYPSLFKTPLLRLEAVLDKFPFVFATRMLIILERTRD